MYVYLRQDYEVKQCAVYVILGYDLQGGKEILGLWLIPTESKNQWMQIFDELKNRGVEDVFFISMYGVSDLKQVLNPYFKMQLYKDVLFISLEIQLNIFLQKNIKNIHNQLKEYMVHHH